MRLPDLRPKFERLTPLNADQIYSQLQKISAQKSGEGILIHQSANYIFLSLHKDQQKIWSPRLTLEVHTSAENNRVLAHFGPNPNVWLLFVFIYSFLAFILTVVGIVGMSQWSLGLSATILWLLPVILLLLAATHYSARTGQRLSSDQMWDLYNFLHQGLGSKLIIVHETES